MTEEHPNFYPIFLSIMSSIKQMKEAGKTWDEIEQKVVGDLIESQGKRYYIWCGQKCGYPQGCNELAIIMFHYQDGIIGACQEHGEPTIKEFLEW